LTDFAGISDYNKLNEKRKLFNLTSKTGFNFKLSSFETNKCLTNTNLKNAKDFINKKYYNTVNSNKNIFEAVKIN